MKKFNLFKVVLLVCLSLSTYKTLAQDTTPPQIVSVTPVDDATQIPTDQWTFTIEFDEPVMFIDHPAAVIQLRDAESYGIADALANTPALTIDENIVSVDFNHDGELDEISLDENAEYHLYITQVTFSDLAENAFEGILDAEGWNFFTIDTQVPEVQYIYPSVGATGVPINEEIGIEFTEDIQKGTGNVELYNQSGLIESLSITDEAIFISNSGDYLGINFNSTLLPETTYYILISSGAVTDIYGNQFAGFNTSADWSFTTMDNEFDPPIIDYLYPEHNTTDVLLEDIEENGLSFGFDEPILPGTGNIEIRDVSDGSLIRSISIDDETIEVEEYDVYIYPINDIPYNSEVTVIICSTCFTDILGNPFPGISSGEWSFTTEVGPLAIETVSPDFNSSNGHVLYLEASFNQGFTIDGLPSDRVLEIYRYSDDQFLSFANVEDVTIDGNNMEVRLAVDVPTGSEVYVSIVDNRIKDLSDNYITPIGKDFWKFTANWDFVERLGFVPENFSTKNPIDGEIKIVYAEDVKRGFDGNYTLRKYTGSEIIASFDFESELVSIEGNEVTFEVNHLLEYNTRYFITMLGYPIRSLNEIPADRFNNNSTFVFTIEPDPELFAQPVSFSPAHQSSGVAIDSDIIIEFTHPVTTGNAYLLFYDRLSGSFIQSVHANTNGVVEGNFATISLDSDLPHNTEVAVRVNEFAFISENHGVIEIADNDTWYFTTEAAPDETPPAIVTISPPDNSTSVSVSSDLVITFDEPIFFGEGPTSAQLRKTGGAFVQDFFNNDNQFVEIEGNTLTLFPFEDLENNQEYYITIGQGFVEDEAGNESVALSSTTAWNFTTALPEDTDPPVVVSLNPLDNATGVALNADLTITFDESIQGVYTGSAFVRVKKVSTDAQILGGRPSHETDQFTIDGNTMTIHLAEYTNAAPEYETEYYVSIPFNSLEDASGNSFAGFEDNMTWSFTTETAPDDTPPSIISITPADNSIDVDPGTNLTIEFDEDVFLGNSSFLVKYYDTNINQFVINYASEDVSVSGNTITINPPGALQGETHYWIQINANTITDTAGNGFPGIVMANRDDWDFTTAGKLDQSITFETPDDKTFGDQPFTLTASASSGLPVTFSVVSGSISIDGDEVTIIGAGSASIRADQEGNEEYNSANGQIRSFDIAKADQTITVEKINNKLTTDDPFEVIASVNTELELTYEVSGPASISGSTITLDGEPGTVEVTITQLGNENYNVASASITFQVNDPTKIDQSISFDEISDKIFGDPTFELSASASSGLDVIFEIISGPASLSENSTVTITGAGEVVVSANQPGDESYNPAPEVIRSFDIAKADQTITIESIADKLITDDPFDVVASVDSGLELSYEVDGPASISGATITLDGSAGTVIITVRQNGNENYNSGSEMVGFEVSEQSKTDQSISFDQISDKTYGDDSFTISASATSSLPVEFNVVSGPVLLNGNEVTINGAGTAVIAANQTGNDEFNAATEVTQSFNIAKADQIITIESIDDKLVSDDPFEISASVDSNLELTYEVDGPAEISGTTIILDGALGTVIVSVSQAGNENYNATSESITFEVIEEQVLAVKSPEAIKIYPNPVIHYLTIDCDQLIEVSVFDLEGRKVKTKLMIDQKIDLSSLSNGIYILELRNDTEIRKIKIVKAN